MRGRSGDGDGRQALRGDGGPLARVRGTTSGRQSGAQGSCSERRLSSPARQAGNLLATNSLPQTEKTPNPKRKPPQAAKSRVTPHSGPARRPRRRPRLTRAPGMLLSNSKALGGRAAIRDARPPGFFALGECRRLASKAIGGCDGPPQSPAFSPRSISPIRGFSSSRRGAKLFMAASLKARGCAAALSTPASLPPPAADPRPAATGPAPPARGAVGTAGGTGGHRSRPPAVDAALPWSPRWQGRSRAVAGPKPGLLQAGAPKWGWVTDTGGSCLQAADGQAGSCLSASGAFRTRRSQRFRCAAEPDQFGSQKPTVAQARQCWRQRNAGTGMLTVPPSHPGAGQPLLLPPCAGTEWGGHGSLGVQPPVPCPIAAGPDPVQCCRAAAALGAPKRLLAQCAGKSADGKRVVVVGESVAFCTT